MMMIDSNEFIKNWVEEMGMVAKMSRTQYTFTNNDVRREPYHPIKHPIMVLCLPYVDSWSRQRLASLY